MSRIFVSHSSENNAQALALARWLAQEGWDDIFLGLDPERGLKAGERWEEALRDAADRCEAIIFLVSHAWLASEWCRPLGRVKGSIEAAVERALRAADADPAIPRVRIPLPFQRFTTRFSAPTAIRQ